MNTISVDTNNLYRVLKSAKKQSSDIVIIPRFLNTEYNNGWEISGIQSRTITVISEFSEFKDLYSMPLWENPSLSYIALYSKDISPYLKILQENSIDILYFVVNQYIVNRIPISIATSLESDKKILLSNPHDPKAKPIMTKPILLLIPYQEYLDKVKLMQIKFETATIVNEEEIDMKNDIEFSTTWDGLSSDGAKIWVPDINKYNDILKPYMLYLAKCMFNFSKADQVFLQIRDNIIRERNDVFMARFTVLRKKGKEISKHQYYMSGFKL